ncbi:MAG: PQQ-binding-like beta-propeller repeat protein [Nitrososphaerales archaeon]
MTLFIGSDDENLYALHLDGSTKWKSKLDGMARSSSPCISDEKLFIGTYNGAMCAISVDNGMMIWEV